MEAQNPQPGKAEIIEQWIRANLRFTFARSGGSGGQNVNKVNTKAVAILPIDTAEVFTDDEKLRLHERLGTRINSEGNLVVHAAEERSQSMNREAAIERILRLVFGALAPRKKRRPTRPGFGAREERLRQKKQRSERKRERGTDY